ncbi:MAG: terminase [Parcubacteria group bacterium]|nr:terminase [Parcubacteria group bacterium]
MNEIIWQPLEGPQALAISCPADEILYEGTRGPGKTDAQLMFFRKHVGQGYGGYWKGVIFDREYKNLDDLVDKSRKWFDKFGDGAKFLASKSDYRWVWPTGEQLLFRAIKRESDYWNYHGQEFPFIGWNELAKYPDLKIYDAMMSCNRSGFLPEKHSPKNTQTGKIDVVLPDLPLVTFSTTNPYGAGHNAVKKRFIDPAPPGKMYRTEVEVFNPRTQQKEMVTKTRVRIFGSYKENIYLDAKYIADLVSIKEPNKRKAWLEGDWNIVAGGAIDDLWNENIHVKQRFKIPHSWRIDRTFDWGSTKPFSVGWWAEANGEEVKLANGNTWCPAAGSYIRIAEWYGCQKDEHNEGLRMSAKKVAEGILEREKILKDGGWIKTKVYPGAADGSIYGTDDPEEDSIGKKMSKAGVEWIKANKAPGTRITGLQLVRDSLDSAIDGVEAGPGLYFFDNCTDSIATLPVLPRCEKNPDDVDTDAEDHIYDEVRYKLLAEKKRYANAIKVKHAT